MVNKVLAFSAKTEMTYQAKNLLPPGTKELPQTVKIFDTNPLLFWRPT